VRFEGKAGESARPGQYALLCTSELMKNIPKQIHGFAVKLVVFFGRRARCVVVWAEACFGWQVTAGCPALPHVSNDVWSRK
jgi:hypothetical protein